MMTYMPPAGAGPSAPGAAPGAPPAQGAPQGPPGDPQMDMIMQVAMMVLGRPPQSEQELMQVIQVMAAMQSPEGAAEVGGGPGASPQQMPASNGALVRAVNGGF